MLLYHRVIPGAFRTRPNRFIAQVETEEGLEICHVKNTGRCRELLVPGARVTLAVSDNAARKTRCDLVAVEKGSLYINMDSQAPNRAAGEALPRLFPELTLLRPETKCGDSRLDFYLEAAGKNWFVEVKGVTLEENGVVRFPDAPTLRGVKHLNGLLNAKKEGYEAAVCFVVQMEGVKYLEPNDDTHPEFGQALRRAAAGGVEVLAFACRVKPDAVVPAETVPVILGED